MGKKGLYKMNCYCGCNGNLEGLFIEDSERVRILIEKEVGVYFGEVLGKHSDIYGSIDPEDIELITDDQAVIKVFEENDISSGYNPFDYESFDAEEFEGCNDEMSVSEVVDELLKQEANA